MMNILVMNIISGLVVLRNTGMEFVCQIYTIKLVSK